MASPVAVSAADSGWVDPTGHANSTAGDPVNAYLSDGQYAELAQDQSVDYTFVTPTGLLPEGATLTGVEVRVQAKASANRTVTAQLAYDASLRGSSKTTPNLSGSDTYHALGGQFDLWGYNAWTAAEVNSAGFSVRVSSNANPTHKVSLNHIQVRLHYTMASTSITGVSGNGVFGSDITLTATLKSPNSSGTGVAGRQLQFRIDGVDFGTPVITDSAGTATVSGAAPSGFTDSGSYLGKVSAHFSGDSGYTSSSGTGNLTISKATASVTLGDLTPTYDGTAKAASATTVPVGLTVALTYDGSAAPPTNAGSYAVVGTIVDDNYQGSASGTMVISPRTLTVFYTGVDKVYDGTKDATVTTTDDRVADDKLAILWTAAFADKNVGEGKAISVSGVSLGGADAGNYTVAATGSATADITARTLTVAYTGVDKVYDGTKDATVTTTDDRVADDKLTILRTAAFADKNVGEGKAISVSGVSLGGADAGNYTVAATGSATADITPRDLTLSGFWAANKIWDGTTEVFSSGFSDNRVTGDSLVFGYDVAFEDAHVGSNKSVNFTNIVINGGADEGNYTLVTLSGTAQASITRRPTTLTYTGATTGQYSDPADLRAVLRDATSGGVISGKTVVFSLGSQGPVSGTTAVDGVAAHLLVVTQGPGARPLSAAFDGDTWYDPATAGALTYTVTREHAVVDYTGPTFVNTVSTTSGMATVQLRATVRDITAVPDAGSWDAYGGDITKAGTVSFFNTTGSTRVLIATVSLQLVNPLDSTAATASFDWAVNIGSSQSETYEITVVVNGWYTGETEEDIITVSRPLATEFITGGGHVKVTNSAGLYAAGVGTKTNFGFNVKYNKAGKNLQGQVNVIFRSADGRTYQIKANAFQSLTVDRNSGTAAFYSKANLQDVTDPLNPISLGGNLSLELKVIDGDPVGNKKGAMPDRIGIALWTSSGQLLFSSNWSGVTTVEQELAGGNVVVR
jgi:hypothetical protein